MFKIGKAIFVCRRPNIVIRRSNSKLDSAFNPMIFLCEMDSTAIFSLLPAWNGRKSYWAPISLEVTLARKWLLQNHSSCTCVLNQFSSAQRHNHRNVEAKCGHWKEFLLRTPLAYILLGIVSVAMRIDPLAQDQGGLREMLWSDHQRSWQQQPFVPVLWDDSFPWPPPCSHHNVPGAYGFANLCPDLLFWEQCYNKWLIESGLIMIESGSV